MQGFILIQNSAWFDDDLVRGPMKYTTHKAEVLKIAILFGSSFFRQVENDFKLVPHWYQKQVNWHKMITKIIHDASLDMRLIVNVDRCLQYLDCFKSIYVHKKICWPNYIQLEGEYRLEIFDVKSNLILPTDIPWKSELKQE